MRGIDIWKTIADDANFKSSHPGAQHIQQFTGQFHPSGSPTASTLTLVVFEPLGRWIDQVLEDFSPPSKVPWPHRFSREVCQQILLGLDYLHSQSIMHRDTQTGNIILALRYPINALSEAELESRAKINHQLPVVGTVPLVHRDGQLLYADDPKCLVDPSPLNDQTTIPSTTFSTIRILLTDLGAASTFSNASDG